MPTRMLFLDDSGKPDGRDATGAVVIAGVAMNAEDYPIFRRRVSGAKAHFFPGRGRPQDWEIKSLDFIKPNPWKRAKNRRFLAEIARIITTVGGTAYSASIVKANMLHPMTLQTTMPLQLQALAEHFDAECRVVGRDGIIVSDWSSHQHDAHASRCVGSFVTVRNLVIQPCVYYANSQSNEAIQTADLIAGIRRRTLEGDTKLTGIDHVFRSLVPRTAPGPTTFGRTYNNWVELI